MKSIALLAVTVLLSFGLNAQTKPSRISTPDKSKKVQVVEASCGECHFGMKGESCELAVKIDGKPYFVDGTSIKDYGDAHAKGGFCKAVRKAEVQGDIVDGRFKATYFKLLPEKK